MQHRYILLICLFITITTFSRRPPRESPTPEKLYRGLGNEKWKVKLSLFNQTYFSLPTLKVSGEYALSDWEMPISAGIDLGYNFYSQDEQVNVNGYFGGGRLNFYVLNKPWQALAISVSIFGSKTYINDYLKTTLADPNLGEYSYYEKFNYTKERKGLSSEAVWQFKVYKKIFCELALGAAFVKFTTNVPDNVTQRTFINGLSVKKTYIGPAPLFSFKIGYIL